MINGMLGVTTWSYAYTARASRVFLQDYVAAFGQIPGPRAAALYDGIWALRAAMVNQGIAPESLKAGLLNAPNQVLVQGILRPTEFANGDISRNVMVYQLEPGGGATVLALFDGPRRMFLEDAGN
jgi:ABC-type branched-subunit amino acid transport system substrate-binding protein